MPRRPDVPRDLRLLPFRGSVAVATALLTSTQLRGAGWRRLLPDVYIAADVPMDHRMWCHAALIYATARAPITGVRAPLISGLSAASVWGIDLLPIGGAPVELTVSNGVAVRPRPPFVVIRHANLESDDRALAGVLPTTLPLRTAFDLARKLDRVEALVVLDAFTHRRLFTVAQFVDYAAAHPSLPGSRQLPELLAQVEPLTESPMETRTRLTLTDGGLPRPVAQFEVRDANGRFIGRVDLAYPEYQIGIEYEGDDHRQRTRFRADITRGNAIQAAEWRMIRVTYEDIYPNPDKFLTDVRETLRVRDHEALAPAHRRAA